MIFRVSRPFPGETFGSIHFVNRRDRGKHIVYVFAKADI